MPVSQDLEEKVKSMFGFVPNSLAEMCKDPFTIQVYLQGINLKKEHATLTFIQRHIVEYITSALNGDEYCIQMHAKFLKTKAGFTVDELNEMKYGGLPSATSHPDVIPIIKLVRTVINKKGKLTNEDILQFENMKITRDQMYEVITSIHLKSIQNYVNNLSNPLLDERFADNSSQIQTQSSSSQQRK
ncbi:hypothetical protein C9374_011735 [Naegleria lovaniensis]|uniref:Carboxymuconolactone decarboxylase-like domain-containing protein n=1 Tax=Naegleria lovaniensis TaxID=51637 RepID=A0AA88KCH9_NAELO|nr:uncharacterized protein C9374_011735 [Naegleria lovaniensis]KAG2373850.1 hypothetical protein C9374_011735 [Naegleria lovaniensis]